MDELLEELDVSYQDLFKLHTGHRSNEELDDSDQDSHISSDSSLDHLKPPLYTFEELQENLVVIKPESTESNILRSGEPLNQSEEIQSDTSKFVQKVPKSDDTEILRASSSKKIAERLSGLITRSYCHICKKQSKDHYKYTNHYRKVIRWLKIELLMHDLPEGNVKFYFCEVCNLPLSGNETAQNHYEEISHKENAGCFCLLCLQKVTRVPMSEHLLTHRLELTNENSLIQQPGLTKENEIFLSNEDLVENTTPTSQANNFQRSISDFSDKSTPTSQTNSFQVLPSNFSDNSTPTSQTNSFQIPISDFSDTSTTTPQTNNLQIPMSDFSNKSTENIDQQNIVRLSYADALKQNNKNNDSMYQSSSVTNEGLKRGNKPVEVKDYRSLAQYILNLLSPSFCYICNVPALSHYKTEYHNKTFFKWIITNKHMLELFGIEYIESLICFACRAVFFNSSYADSHYASEEHKQNVNYYCKLCMVHDDDSKKHREHNQILINEDNLRDILYSNRTEHKTVFDNRENQNENNFTQYSPGKIIATKLILMLTPIYCYICQECVNVRSFSNHYFERGHMLMLRRWLSFEIQKLGVIIDPNLIYCESCNLELCGTNLAVNHYQTAIHIHNQQMYCAICVVRGTPNAIFQHYYTREHQYNYEALRLLHRQNKAHVVSQESNCSAPLPEALAKAITSSHCELCGVMFPNIGEAQIHYKSKSHIAYVNLWLQKNNMLCRDNNINSESFSSLTDSSATSQQDVQNKLGSDNNLTKLETKQIPDIPIKCDENNLDSGCYNMLGNKGTEVEPKNGVNMTKLQSEKDIIEKNFNSLVPIIKLPTANNSSREEIELYKKVNDQVMILLNQVYCIKAVPLEASLIFLEKFNKTITEAKTPTVDIGNNDSHVEQPSIKNNKTDTLSSKNIMEINWLSKALFSVKSKSGMCEEDPITQSLLQRKNLLEYERKNLKTAKNITNSVSDTSPRNVPLSRALDGQLGGIINSSWRCAIL